MVPDIHGKFHNQPFIMRRAIWRHVFGHTDSLTHTQTFFNLIGSLGHHQNLTHCWHHGTRHMYAKFHNQPFIMRRAIWRHVFGHTDTHTTHTRTPTHTRPRARTRTHTQLNGWCPTSWSYQYKGSFTIVNIYLLVQRVLI